MAQGYQLTDPNKKKTKKQETVDLFYNGNGATYGSQISTSTPTPTYTPVIEEDLKTTIQVDGANPTLIQEPVKYGDVLNASDPSVTGTSTGGLGSGIKYGYYTNGDGNSNGDDGAEKVETGDGDEGGDNVVPTPTPPPEEEKKETPVISYAEWVAEQKRLEEEKRQTAYKEAELYKERASADAQASYAQNMSTYGINAENMAKMGLTGGGYSDYLNAQAYAQKRGDLQAANAQELALKQQADSTYEANIAKLDKGLLDYQLENSNAEKNSAGILLDAIAKINETGGISSEELQALGAYGLSEKDLADITAYNQKAHYQTYKSAITGEYDVNTTNIDVAYENGLLTQPQYEELKSDWNKSIDTSVTFFKKNNETISFDDAKTALKTVEENSWASPDVKDKLTATFTRTYADEIAQEVCKTDGIQPTGKIVDIYSNGYTASDWGEFNDINKADSGQGRYVAAIIEAEKQGLIEVGRGVIMNYGDRKDDGGMYIYIGDGVFTKIKWKEGVQLYIPDGYKYEKAGDLQQILEEDTDTKKINDEHKKQQDMLNNLL